MGKAQVDEVRCQAPEATKPDAPTVLETVSAEQAANMSKASKEHEEKAAALLHAVGIAVSGSAIPNSILTNAAKADVEEWFCVGCSATFIDRETLRQHKDICPDWQGWACTGCKEVFVSEKKLNEHRKYICDAWKAWGCLACSERFSSEKQLKGHRKGCQKMKDLKDANRKRNKALGYAKKREQEEGQRERRRASCKSARDGRREEGQRGEREE